MWEFAKELGFTPVAPPKRSRKKPWDYDLEKYKERNGIERFFRCVCTYYGKLDTIFSAFIYLTIISIVFFA